MQGRVKGASPGRDGGHSAWAQTVTPATITATALGPLGTSDRPQWGALRACSVVIDTLRGPGPLGRALGPWAGRAVGGLVSDVVPRTAAFWGQTGQPQQERGSKPRTAGSLDLGEQVGARH